MSNEALEMRGTEILGCSGDPAKTYNVKKYDFKRPDKFSREQIRTFQMIHESIARRLTATIATRIGKPAEVTIAAVDQLTFEEFLRSVPEICAFAVVGMSPLRGTIVMEIDGKLATLLMDSACGQGADTLTMDDPSSKLTELDEVIVGSLIEHILPSFQEGWSSAIELSPSLYSIESSKRDVMIVPPTEMIILASVTVTVGVQSAIINVAVPYLTIEPIVHKLSAWYWYSKVRHKEVPMLGGRAREVAVESEIAIPLDSLSIADVPGILSGSPIPLPSLEKARAVALVGSTPVAEVAFTADKLSEPILSLQVIASQMPASETSPDAQSNALSAVTAQLGGVLADIKQEVRDLRVAVGEMQQNQDVVIATREDGASSDSFGDRRITSIEFPSEFALLISGERPETVAFLLAPLDAESAARILAALEPGLRMRTVGALSTLDSADLSLHTRLVTFLRRRIKTRRDTSVAGGAAAIAEILTRVPRSVEKAVMEQFQTDDEPLFESIARQLFVFEDFVLVDETAIRKVAERVEPELLALALTGVAKEVTSHIVGALEAERIAEIEEAESSIGRVRRSDVEAAQRELIEELRALEAAGEVVVIRPDEAFE